MLAIQTDTNIRCPAGFSSPTNVALFQNKVFDQISWVQILRFICPSGVNVFVAATSTDYRAMVKWSMTSSMLSFRSKSTGEVVFFPVRYMNIPYRGDLLFRGYEDPLLEQGRG